MKVTQTEADDYIATNKEALEAISSSIPQREIAFEGWVMPNGMPVDGAKIYIQGELGMFYAQEFATIIAATLRGFVSGEMGMKLGDLFRGDIQKPVTYDPEELDKAVDENRELIAAFFKLIEIAPGLQKDIICLSLGIDSRERPWAKEQFSGPISRGGLSIPEAFDILKWFVRQNAKLLRETFVGEAQELAEIFRLEVLGQTPTETVESTATEREPALAGSLGGTQSSTSSPPTPDIE